MKKVMLFFIFFIYSNLTFSMESEEKIKSLAALAIKKTANNLDNTRQLLNFPFNNDSLFSEDNQQKFREELKQSGILKEIYLHNVQKDYLGAGNCESIEFDENRVLIIENYYKEVTVGEREEPDGSFRNIYKLVPCYCEFYINGKIRSVRLGQHYLPNKNSKAHLSNEEKKQIFDIYCLEINGDAILISNNLIIELNNNYIKSINLRKSNQILDFCINRMPIRQVLLLLAIEHAKKQDRYLDLTEIEEEVFKGLLPGIKDAVKKYIDFNNKSPLTLACWKSFWKAVFLKPESKFHSLRYKAIKT